MTSKDSIPRLRSNDDFGQLRAMGVEYSVDWVIVSPMPHSLLSVGMVVNMSDNASSSRSVGGEDCRMEAGYRSPIGLRNHLLRRGFAKGLILLPFQSLVYPKSDTRYFLHFDTFVRDACF